MFVEYLFVDSKRLRNYAEQIGAHKLHKKVPTLKVGFAITGPSVEGTQVISEQTATVHEMIEGVLKYLRSNDLLLTSRPWSEHEVASSRTPFVLETMRARKITFQVEQIPGLKGLRELGIWVSNPTERPAELAVSKEDHTVPKGMFLYMVEGYWQADADVQHGFSEFSALNHVLTALHEVGVAGEEVSARDNFNSPVEILRKAGGVVGEPRMVRSLYRMRSVTDNQFVMIGTTVHRTFDVFGYPIFVAEA